MKSKKMVASTIAMLVMTCSILSFVSCDNMNSNNNSNSNENTSEGGGQYTGLSEENKETITFKDYSSEDTHETLNFTKIKSGNNALPFLSKKAIKVMFEDTNPTRLERIAGNTEKTIDEAIFGQQNMFEVPSFSGTYIAGEPRSDIMDLALARYNVIRRFAGLNGAVYNKQFHIEAQWAAWVCAKDFRTRHEISAYTKPEGITDEVWKLIETGISQCLYLRPHAANSVDIYMGDNKNGNLGHRKNLLNLYTSQVGFGVTSANLNGIDMKNQNRWNLASGATAFRFNWQRQPDYEDFEYDMVSWPPAGYFPAKTSLFDSGVDKARWSIYFNNNKYALQTTADSNGVKTNVIVTKTVNGETKQVWDFAKIASNVEAFKNKNYTLTEGESWCSITYGGTTIFYLASIKNGQESLEQYTDGSVYTVRFENLVDKVNGGFTNLEYAVEFFDMSTVQ